MALRGLGAALFIALALPASADAATASFVTGAEQTFVVPAGVSSVHVVALGAPGASGGASGGRGAWVSGDLPVAPGQTLFVEVGGKAHYTGTAKFTLEEGDEIGQGFLLR